MSPLILRLSLLCLFAATWQSYALGIRIADQDARATARGNAFVATADNPSAIYYNPAGITQLDGPNIRVGGYFITLDSKYRSPSGREVDTEDEILGVPHFYYANSLENLPIWYGLGIYSPYGLGLEWPEDTGFRTLAIEGRLLYATLSPIIAWQVHPTLSIAGGPTINYSKTKLRRGIFTPGDRFEFEGDDFGYGFVLGLRWQPHEQHAFGVSYRSATDLNHRGDAKVRFGALRSRASASAEIDFPQHIVAGYSYRPTKSWNFEVNVDWTDWDRLDTVRLKQASGDVELPFHWRSSFFYEFGVTYFCPNGLAISGGYIFSENSVPDESFNPAVPDSDRHIFSLGIGQRINNFTWDAGYQLAYGPWRKVDGSPANLLIGESADGKYHFVSHALTFSVGYSF